MSKSKDGRGRKEHELKKMCRDRAEVRHALFELATTMRRMTDLVEHIVSNGIDVKTEVIRIKNISVPTLTDILGEHGHTRHRGRPKAGTATTSPHVAVEAATSAPWTNNPQAIEIVADVLRNHGIHKGREKLLAEGIDCSENGENKHYSFVGSDGLSITTLMEIAKNNGISFESDQKSSSAVAEIDSSSLSSSSPVIENSRKDDDEDDEEEDEDDEDEEDEDEDDEEDSEEDSEDEEDGEEADDEDDEEFDDDLDDIDDLDEDEDENDDE